MCGVRGNFIQRDMGNLHSEGKLVKIDYNDDNLRQFNSKNHLQVPERNTTQQKFKKRKMPIFNERIGNTQKRSQTANIITKNKKSQKKNTGEVFQDQPVQEFDVNLQELSRIEKNLISIQSQQLLPIFQHKGLADNFVDSELQAKHYPITAKKEKIRLYDK